MSGRSALATDKAAGEGDDVDDPAEAGNAGEAGGPVTTMSRSDTRTPPAHSTDASVSVSVAYEVDLELISAFGRLIPQLSKSSSPPDADQLAEMLASPGTTVFVARSDDDGVIVGILTLVVFRIPTGLRAWIEDVVVDQRVGAAAWARP